MSVEKYSELYDEHQRTRKNLEGEVDVLSRRLVDVTAMGSQHSPRYGETGKWVGFIFIKGGVEERKGGVSRRLEGEVDVLSRRLVYVTDKGSQHSPRFGETGKGV